MAEPRTASRARDRHFTLALIAQPAIANTAAVEEKKYVTGAPIEAIS